MKAQTHKTTPIIAILLAALITTVCSLMPRQTMAQQGDSQTLYATPQQEGFPAAASRSTADETRLKEDLAREKREAAASASADAGSRSEMAAPPNDMFANALVLVGGNENIALGTNVDATKEAGEPGNSNIKSVWFSWTPTSNVSITFETEPGNNPVLADTILAVYTGTAVNNLQLVATDDDINFPHNLHSRVTFIADAGTTYLIRVIGFNGSSGNFLLNRKINTAETNAQFNFDASEGSTVSDYAVFRPSNNTWYVNLSYNGTLLAQQWGLASDTIHSGDFDGDGNTDICIWRPETGTFYALRSLDGTVIVQQWGQNGDVPVQGDFDGDDKADFAVFRPGTGTFYVRKSTDGQMLAQQFGQSGDFVACGDYDGDGRTDFGVQRGSDTSTFYILRSSDGAVTGAQFGLGSDSVVPGDYDGDGKNDIAVYRANTGGFYALSSKNGSLIAVQWGQIGDRIVPGDYTGDDRSDVTVFRPSNGTFYSLNLGNNALRVYQWGADGDYPIARSNVH